MEIASIASAAGNIGVIVIIVVVLLIIIGVFFYLFDKWKKYSQFDIEIWQKDGFGQFNVKKDRGGIYVDNQTQNKRLFLQKNNVGLDPDNVPYLPAAKGKKKVYLFQTGLKNFKYIKPRISDNMIYFSVGEEDVNWAINAYERQKKLFGQHWLVQYAPFIILAFTSIIMLVLFINLFKHFPEILEIAKTMKEVAIELGRAKSGTTILQ